MKDGFGAGTLEALALDEALEARFDACEATGDDFLGEVAEEDLEAAEWLSALLLVVEGEGDVLSGEAEL